MRITPLDIQQKQFPIKLRGFDVEEVYAFLEVVREEMEELMRENSFLKENIYRVENQLKEYKDMESTLRETLITAQQMVEDYKGNARKESELIAREAELRADAIIAEAQEKVVKIHEDIVDLKGIRRHFKEELRRMIESHVRMLDFDAEREAEGGNEAAASFKSPSVSGESLKEVNLSDDNFFINDEDFLISEDEVEE